MKTQLSVDLTLKENMKIPECQEETDSWQTQQSYLDDRVLSVVTPTNDPNFLIEINYMEIQFQHQENQRHPEIQLETFNLLDHSCAHLHRT